MTIEIKLLIWSVLLGILQILIVAQAATRQRGVDWNLSARVIYVPLYAFNVKYLRTLVWGCSLVGILILAWQAF